MRRSKKMIASVTIAAAAFGLAACGAPDAAKPVTPAAPEAPRYFPVVSAGSFDAANPIPLPSDPVLELTGRISRTNAKGNLSIDLATLEKMPVVGGSVYEPFVKKSTNFSGVLVSDLLAAAGADVNASNILITALDDYTWTLPIDVARSGEVLLATHENGEAIPIENGGPIRIVFSDRSVAGKQTDSWVWSVSGIEVR